MTYTLQFKQLFRKINILTVVSIQAAILPTTSRSDISRGSVWFGQLQVTPPASRYAPFKLRPSLAVRRQMLLGFPLELSRDITENFSVMGTPSLQPFLKSYWLTPVNDWPIVAKHAIACKYWRARGSIKCGARDNYVRIFSFTTDSCLLEDDVLLPYLRGTNCPAG